MKIGLTVGGALLAALLVAPGVGLAQESDDTSSGTTSMVVIEQIDPEQQTDVDLGEEGYSQGDMFVFTGSLTDEEGEETGKSSGFCIVTDAEEGLSECVWTYHFEEGTITIAGTEPDLGPDTEIHMPIVGGTGDYAGARGLIHEQHNEELTIFTTTIEIIDSSLMLDASAEMTETETTESVVDFWNAAEWADLTEEEQAAWNVLGWDETNWDVMDPTTIPASESTAWADLSEEEQEAATSLGYDETSWADVQARVPEGDVEEFWSAQSWDDLKYSEMRLWSILGWDADSWEEATDAPESETKVWAELTPEEQAAATQLGYTEETWDAATP